jgi:hypothetical protein
MVSSLVVPEKPVVRETLGGLSFAARYLKKFKITENLPSILLTNP